jgi:hypothetical protein
LSVSDHKPGSVLTVQETSYPGWTVTVDGKPAQIESVGGRIGVRLPDKPAGSTTSVLFAYKPTVLYASAVITLVMILIFAGYLLNLDRFLPERVTEVADATLQSLQRRLLSESGVGGNAVVSVSSNGHENGKSPRLTEIVVPEPESDENGGAL